MNVTRKDIKLGDKFISDMFPMKDLIVTKIYEPPIILLSVNGSNILSNIEEFSDTGHLCLIRKDMDEIIIYKKKRK